MSPTNWNRSCPWGLLVVVLASISATVAHGEISFATLDDPLAVYGTGIGGVSGSTVVGSYTDAAHVSHGFIYDGTSYVTIDHPLASNTQAYVNHSAGTSISGISGSTVVGSYGDSAGISHGFVYNGSSFQTVDDPLGLGGLGTWACGISGNNIVGWYLDSSFHPHGFLYDGFDYQTLNCPWAPDHTQAFGIDGTNIVGSAGGKGFLYDGTSFTSFDGPPGSGSAWASGISGNHIVGGYFANVFASQTYGFLYDGSVYRTIDDPLELKGPGAAGTCGTTVNGIDGNIIVGSYIDSNGGHGFVATVPEPSTVVLLAMGAVTILGLAWRRRIAGRSSKDEKERRVIATRQSPRRRTQLPLETSFADSASHRFSPVQSNYSRSAVPLPEIFNRETR